METVHFNYNPFQIARLILIHYFEKELQSFNMKNLSHKNYPIEYSCPKFVVRSVNDTIDTLTDKQLEEIMTKIGEEKKVTDEFKTNEHVAEIFDRIVKTDLFKSFLKTNHIKYLPLDSCVIDKTTDRIYKATFGKHFETIMNIIALYPELNTLGKQDDFVLNKLEIIGAKKDDIEYYTPDDIVEKNNSNLKEYDYLAVFEKVYDDTLKSLSTPKPKEPNWYLEINAKTAIRPLKIFTHSKNIIIHNLVKYRLIDEVLKDFPEYFEDVSSDIINFAIETIKPIKTTELNGIELMELYPTYALTLKDYPDLEIYK